MTITRTFSTTLKADYLADSIIECVSLSDMIFDATDQVAVYLEAVDAVVDVLKSINVKVYPSYDGSETEAEKVSKFDKAQAKSQKFGIKFLKRKQGQSNNWTEISEVIIENAGKRQQLDFLPRYLTQAAVRVLEKNDILAVQLVNYGWGLIKSTDKISLDFSIRIELEKMLQNLPQTATGNSPSNSPNGGTQFNLTTTSTQVLADRSGAKNRRQLTLYNAGTDSVLFNYGSTVSLTSFVAEILPGGFWGDLGNNQGPVAARAKTNPTTLNVTELIII